MLLRVRGVEFWGSGEGGGGFIPNMENQVNKEIDMKRKLELVGWDLQYRV